MKISNNSLRHYTLKHIRLLRIGVGDLYSGIKLEWNYVVRWVDIAMPLYAIKNIKQYNHEHAPPLKPQHCPYTPDPIAYGKDNQEAPMPSDTSPLINAAGKKRIQRIVGNFLYYARAVNPTIFMALSAIAAQQSAPPEETLGCVNQSTTCGRTPMQKSDTELPT